jgi:hypothetical protein
LCREDGVHHAAILVVCFAILFSTALFLNREGTTVPGNNEDVYLIYLARPYQPDLLAQDWTLAGRDLVHAAFNWSFGWLTLLFSLKTVGWIGRVLVWSLTIVGLLRLGRNYRIPMWAITISIFLWMLYRQSVVSRSWMIGTFESKCVAYILLLFSLDRFTHRKFALGAALLGLSFTFHPLVGLWAGLAAGFALVMMRTSPKTLLKCGALTVLFGLPGLLLMLPAMGQMAPASSAIWEFTIRAGAWYHLDPSSFPKRDLLLLLLMFAFNAVHGWSQRKDEGIRLLTFFQVGAGIWFALGYVAHAVGWYALLGYYPFRVFSLLVPLFFFFQLMRALRDLPETRYRPALAATGVLVLLCLDNPLALLVDQARQYRRMWAVAGKDDYAEALKWVRGNTPEDAILITPPWKKSWFYSRRALVVQFNFARYDRLAEWRERVLATCGPPSADGRYYAEEMERNYFDLSEAGIAAIRERFGGDYLVTTANYSYPVAEQMGRYKIYDLRGDEKRVE